VVAAGEAHYLRAPKDPAVLTHRTVPGDVDAVEETLSVVPIPPTGLSGIERIRLER